MAGVKTVADARMKITLLVTPPAELTALTATELTAGVDVSCLLARNGTTFTAADSESLSDPAICEEGNAEVLARSNYTASVAPFWMLDPADGTYAAADNAAYEATRVKNSRVVFVVREGPHYAVAWAVGDTYDAFEVLTDNPQRGDGTGYIKRTVPLKVQRAALDATVAAA